MMAGKVLIIAGNVVPESHMLHSGDGGKSAGDGRKSKGDGGKVS